MSNTLKIIKKFIRENYGANELEDPCYDLEALANEIDSDSKNGQIIGQISVDSGTIMVADPCYWVGKDDSWESFCDEIGSKRVHNFNHSKLVSGKGTAISCDDGVYYVKLDFDEETGKKRLIVEL